MSLIAMPRRTDPSWKQGFARSDSASANPGLRKGLVGLWAPSLGSTGTTLRDVSTGRKYNSNINIAVWGSRGLFIDTVGDVTWNAGKYPLVGDGDFSVMVDFAHDFASNALRGILIYGDTGATAGNWGFGIDNEEVFFRSWPVGGSLTTVSVATSQGDMTVVGAPMRRMILVRHASDGAVDVWIDGLFEGSIAAQTGDLSAAQATLKMLMPFGRGVNQFIGFIGVLAFWNRVVFPNEIQQLHQDPDALLRLRRRVFAAAVVAPPAGGGVNRVIGGGIII